jgi:polyisoprenoid-binding protein YceI
MRRLNTFAAFAFAAAAPLAFANEIPPASTAPVPAGAYSVDKAHTSLQFRVKHLGFSYFTGRFTNVNANLKFDPNDLRDSSVNVTVDPKSIYSDNAPGGFIDTLTGAEFLDAAKYPQMSFVSKSVESTGDQTFRIRGELTLHGVTKPVTLEARYNGGYAGHPYDPHARVGFSASGTFKRSDFGVSFGVPSAENHYFGVSDDVQVVLESEFSGPALAKVASN